MRDEVKSPLYIQYAALPWRRSEGVLEILLITTLTTGRWIVPKGWPIAGLSPAASAAQEALEEAGIAGTIEPAAIGSYSCRKLRKSGETVTCTVDVFPLEVKSQKQTWAEKATRQFDWLPVEEALARVQEPGLRRILLKFTNAHRKPARISAPIAHRAATHRA